MYKTIILALFLIGSIVCEDSAPVCPIEDIEPCKCYQKSSQIRCEPPLQGRTLDKTRLNEIGKQIKGVWTILYIHNTPLTTITAGTFSNAQFKKIFIENNDNFISIEPNAFASSVVTEVIEIRHNGIVEAGPFFDLAFQFEKKLRIFSLEGNKIGTIPPNKLKGVEKFPELQIVNLNDQRGDGEAALKTIPPGAFVNLKNLAQLSLDGNKIATIGNGAIILTESKPSTKHISIFLNNNLLTVDQLTKERITLTKDDNVETKIGLVLEHNHIEALPVDELITKCALKGIVYLGDNPISHCTCHDAAPLVNILKQNDHRNSIQGISPISCDGKTFEACIQQTQM